jgi:hypothetical protein
LIHEFVSRSKPQTSFTKVFVNPPKITIRFSTGSRMADALRRAAGAGPDAGVRLTHDCDAASEADTSAATKSGKATRHAMMASSDGVV